VAKKGWSAKGLLQPLWKRYPGGRDALAPAVGTKPNVLSAINTGKRPLGHDLGGRLAAELGISVLELGAPEAEADAAGRTLLDRLEELAETVSEVLQNQEQGLALLAEILEALDSGREGAQARPTRRRPR